jgi:hypothetical protein
VLVLHLLLGLGADDSVACLAQQSSVRGGQCGALQRQQRLDDRRVRHVDALRRVRGGGDGCTYRLHSSETDTRRRCHVGGLGSELRYRNSEHKAGGEVCLDALGLQRGKSGGAAAGDVPLGEHALALQLVDEPGDVLASGDLLGHGLQTVGVLDGRRDPRRSERTREQQRDDEDHEELGAQPPVPQLPSVGSRKGR